MLSYGTSMFFFSLKLLRIKLTALAVLNKSYTSELILQPHFFIYVVIYVTKIYFTGQRQLQCCLVYLFILTLNIQSTFKYSFKPLQFQDALFHWDMVQK